MMHGKIVKSKCQKHGAQNESDVLIKISKLGEKKEQENLWKIEFRASVNATPCVWKKEPKVVVIE